MIRLTLVTAQVCIVDSWKEDSLIIWKAGYRKTNNISENQNVIVDIAINDADNIRAQILEKLSI